MLVARTYASTLRITSRANSAAYVRASVFRALSSDASETAKPADGRLFTYFDNPEVKDGIAIIRFNGPNKMNTISDGMQKESGELCQISLLTLVPLMSVLRDPLSGPSFEPQ